MSITNIKGVIRYKVKDNHPDLQYIKEEERDKMQEFSDVYHIDKDQFWGEDHIESYIKHDLMLVAGGGYDTDTIKDYEITLTWDYKEK